MRQLGIKYVIKYCIEWALQYSIPYTNPKAGCLGAGQLTFYTRSAMCCSASIQFDHTFDQSESAL